MNERLSDMVYHVLVENNITKKYWRSEFADYSLSALIDMAYNYLDGKEEDEELRNRMAEDVAVEIFGMLH